jgi:hypothetical protein
MMKQEDIMAAMMRSDHIHNEDVGLLGDVPTLNATHEGQQHEPPVRCDDPDEEKQFECPCCVNPWFR